MGKKATAIFLYTISGTSFEKKTGNRVQMKDLKLKEFNFKI